MATTNTNTTHQENQNQDATAIQKAEHPQHQGPLAHTPGRDVTYYTPLVDVAETAEAFLFQADLPGVSAGDVDVSYDRDTLTIEAKAQPRDPAGGRWLWREYGVGHYYRSFNLNVPVDADGIKAELRDGVLSLYVPKAESARKRRIQIKGG